MVDTSFRSQTKSIADEIFYPAVCFACFVGLFYGASPLFYHFSFYKFVEIASHLTYITGLIVLIMRIEACKSVRGISEKMIAIQSISNVVAQMTTFIPALFVRTYLSFVIWWQMRFRYRHSLDHESDDLTLHLAWAPAVAITLAIRYYSGDWTGSTYPAALWLATCQNIYQIRMLHLYCDRYNEKILSQAMSAHFVISTVVFKAMSCVAATIHHYANDRIYLGFSFLQLVISCNFAYYYMKVNKITGQSKLPM